MAGNKKKTTSPAVKGILIVVIILCIGVMGFSAYKLISTQLEYKKSRDEYASLQDYIAQTGGRDEEIGTGTQTNSATEASSVSEELQKNKCPITVDAQGLLEKNPDFVGWIYMEAVEVSYPVVQGRDNSYYLDHFPDGTSSVGGSIFADCACPSDFSGQNTILYGHNMRDGSMFALIDDYIDPAFCEAHPFFYLNTPTRNYRVDIFAGFTTDPESFVYTTAFGEESDFAAYLNTLRSLSDFSVPTELSSSDRILTLSTCTYSDLDVRYVLFGRLAEIG